MLSLPPASAPSSASASAANKAHPPKRPPKEGPIGCSSNSRHRPVGWRAAIGIAHSHWHTCQSRVPVGGLRRPRRWKYDCAVALSASGHGAKPSRSCSIETWHLDHLLPFLYNTNPLKWLPILKLATHLGSARPGPHRLYRAHRPRDGRSSLR